MLAVVLAVAGGLLFAFPSDGTVFVNGQSGSDGDVPTLPTLLYIDYRRVLGIVLLWVGCLLVAGVVGHRLRSVPN
jgi:hypothetical protein